MASCSTNTQKSKPSRRCTKGRFLGPPHRRGRRYKSKAGVHGPSELNLQSNLDLARRLAEAEQKIRRLSAELGDESGKPVKPLARMSGIRAAQQASVEAKISAIQTACLEFASRQIDPTPAALADRVAELIGKPFDKRLLYNDPYVTIWSDPEDYLGKEAIDDDPAVRTYLRLSKRLLVYRIRKAEDLARGLEDRANERLRDPHKDIRPWDD